MSKKLTIYEGQHNLQPNQTNYLDLENELMKANFKETQDKHHALEIENEGLKSQISAMELAARSSDDMIGDLDDKLLKAKHELGEAMSKNNYWERACRDKFEESKTFKDAIKGLKEEVSQRNEELKMMKKNLKQEDK